MTRRRDAAEITKQTHEFREFLVRGGVEKAFDIPPKIEKIFKDAYFALKKQSYTDQYWSVVIGEWKMVLEFLLEEETRSRSKGYKTVFFKQAHKYLMNMKGGRCGDSEYASSLQIDEERREFREFLQGRGISSFFAIPDDFLEILCTAFHEIRYDVCHNWKETLQTWQKIVALLSVVNTSNKNVKEFRDEFKEPPIDRSYYTYDDNNACRASPRKKIMEILGNYKTKWRAISSTNDKEEGLEHVSVWDPTPTEVVNDEPKRCPYTFKNDKRFSKELQATNDTTGEKWWFQVESLRESLLQSKSHVISNLAKCGMKDDPSLRDCINAYAILELLKSDNKDHGFTQLIDGTYDMDKKAIIFINVDNKTVNWEGLFERLGYFLNGTLRKYIQTENYICMNGLVIIKTLPYCIIIRKNTRGA